MLRKFIIIIIVCLLGIYIYEKISVKSYYSERLYEYYNIEFMDPLKSEMLFKEGINDAIVLDKLLYDKEQIDRLLQNDYYKKMRPLVIEYYIDYKFMSLLNDKKQEELRKIIENLELYEEENYYAFFENKKRMQQTLLIVSVKKNAIYIFDSH